MKINFNVEENLNCIGILFSGEGAREQFMAVKIELPCGYKVVYKNAGEIPTVDTPCPCGDPKHWIVKFE